MVPCGHHAADTPQLLAVHCQQRARDRLVRILCGVSDQPAAWVAAVAAHSSRAAPRVTNSWNRPVCAPRQLLGAISELYCGTTCAKPWVVGCLPALGSSAGNRPGGQRLLSWPAPSAFGAESLRETKRGPPRIYPGSVTACLSLGHLQPTAAPAAHACFAPAQLGGPGAIIWPCQLPWAAWPHVRGSRWVEGNSHPAGAAAEACHRGRVVSTPSG